MPEKLIIKHLDVWKAKKEEEERQRLEAQENAIRERVKALVDLGFVVKPGVGLESDSYVLEGTVIEAWKVTGAEDAEWQNLLRSAQVVSAEYHERLEQEQAMAEQIARQNAEEAERLQAEQDRLAREREEHEQRVAAFNQKINEARKNELMAAGMVINGDEDRTYPNELVLDDMVLDIDTLHLDSDEDWERTVAKARDAKREHDEHFAEMARLTERNRITSQRTADLKSNGWIDAELDNAPGLLLIGPEGPLTATSVAVLADISEEEFVTLIDLGYEELQRRKQVEEEATRQRILAEEQERQQREAARAQAEKVAKEAAMSDTEKVMEWVRVVTSAAPTLNSAIGKQGVATLTKNFVASCQKMVDDIKA